MELCTTGRLRAGVVAMLCGILLAGCEDTSTGSSSGESGRSANVEANKAGPRTIQLSWIAPGERVNGEQLSYMTDIDGYIVRYGRDPANLDQQASVHCAVLNCGYNVDDLPPGTWYFAVQTVDSSGLISALSRPVSRTI